MIAASFAFAAMGLLVKAVSGSIPTGEIVAWRTTVTALVLLSVALQGTLVPWVARRAGIPMRETSETG